MDATKPVFQTARITAAALDAEDGVELQALLERCGDYFLLVTGMPPGEAEAQSLFAFVPDGKRYEDKLLLGLYAHGRLVGVLDAVRDQPEAGTLSLGLLMLEPGSRNGGLGTEVYAVFQDWAKTLGARRIRIGVAGNNPLAMRFWTRQGYAPILRKRMTLGVLEQDFVVMTKQIQ